MSMLKQARAEFIRGATRPSASALAGALCVTLGLIGLCAWGVTPHLVAAHPAYFESDDRDEFAYLTARTLHIAEEPPDGTDVVIIGDSAIREAVTEPEDLERLIVQKVGKPVHVKFLAAGGLTQWGMIGVADTIRDHVKGLVLIEISPINVSLPTDFATDFTRIGALASDAYRAEMHDAGLTPPPNLGNYFLDNYRFFVARPQILANVVQGPVKWQQHIQEHKKPWDNVQWKGAYNRIWGWKGTYAQSAPRNLGIYQRMIERLRKNPDLTVALYRCAENPRNLTQWRDKSEDRKALRRYETDLKEWREKIRPKVPLLDVGRDAHVEPEDFWDAFHMMSDEGRARYTEAMAAHVAELLGAEVLGAPAPPASAPAATQAAEGKQP